MSSLTPCFRLSLAVLFLLLAVTHRVSGAAPLPPQPVPPRSLAAALATARRPDRQLAIAVSAETVLLPEESALPAPGLSIGQLAEGFGRLVRPFGSVLAVAPSTMVVLNTHPSDPDPYQDLLPADALKLLVASLAPRQWTQLTSEQGLGLADLNERQQFMFKSLFPDQSLRIFPLPAPGWTGFPKDIRTLGAAELLPSRLRFSKRVQIMIPTHSDDGRDGHTGFTEPTKPGARRGYVCLVASDRGSHTRIAGTGVRAEVPNDPKRGQLDFTGPQFRALVPVENGIAMGSLITRIGEITRTELYAYQRLETRRITIVGTPRQVPAADLLPALALCITGTYRRLGPAFVLTDDLAGAGSRRTLLVEYMAAVGRQRRAILKPAARLVAAHRVDALQLHPGSVSILPDQMKYALPEINGKMQGSGVALSIPFAAMTSEQQQIAREMFDRFAAWEQQKEGHRILLGAVAPVEHVDLDGKLLLLTQPSVQLLVPGLEEPVDLDAVVDASNLMSAPPRYTVTEDHDLLQPSPSQLLDRYPRRAAILRPRTLNELDSMIQAMKLAHLNELWLALPVPGEVRDPKKGTVAPPTIPELLDRALEQTRNTEIRVLPVMDLFYWATAAPPGTVDYTILGETSSQVEARKRQDRAEWQALADETYQVRRPAAVAVTKMAVSPFAPQVEVALQSMLKAAIRPGIAGLIWRETAPPGYEAPEPDPDNMIHLFTGVMGIHPDRQFGYVEEGRLAFLRRTHVDPVDISPPYPSQPDMSLPLFDDPGSNRTLTGQWRQCRADAHLSLLRRLYLVAHAAGIGPEKARQAPGRAPVDSPVPALPLLLDLQGFNVCFGTWDNPEGRLPYVAAASVTSIADLVASARAGSHLMYYGISALAIRKPADLWRELSDGKEEGGWDAVVFDLAPRDPGSHEILQSSADYLNRLVRVLRDGSTTGQAASPLP